MKVTFIVGKPVFAQQRIAMVDGQLRTNKIIDPTVIDLFLSTPREAFAPKGRENAAYVDEDVALGHGRSLMEPLVAARLLQAADLRAGQRALVIAGGNGYLPRLLCDTGLLVTVVEPVVELAAQGKDQVPEAQWVDGGFESMPPGPFERIFVGGAVTQIPKAWAELLTDDGRILTPVSGHSGNDGAIVAAHRSATGLSHQTLANAAVPTLPEFQSSAQFEF